MKRTLALVLALAAPATAQPPAPAPAPPPAPPASKLLENVGFAGSECVRYDDRRDEYLVGNIGGAAGGGFISRVAPDGRVAELKWIENGRGGAVLDRPLGLFVKGATLYVADTATVRMFDRATGAPTGSVAVPGAVRLNDLAVADDGTVYVTDSGTDDAAGALFVIRRGRAAALVARGDALERPNGIAVLADGGIVHGGRGVNLVYRDKAGRLLRERTLPTGRIDGIVALPGGDLLVASQDGHLVYRVPPVGKPSVVAGDIAVPAAIGWDARRNRLLVPQIRAASLAFHELAR